MAGHSVGGHGDYGKPASTSAILARGSEAVEDGHLDIHQKEVKTSLAFGEEIEGSLAIVDELDVVAELFHHGADDTPVDSVVFGAQDPKRPGGSDEHPVLVRGGGRGGRRFVTDRERESAADSGRAFESDFSTEE